jgi:hypothetical protein
MEKRKTEGTELHSLVGKRQASGKAVAAEGNSRIAPAPDRAFCDFDLA